MRLKITAIGAVAAIIVTVGVGAAPVPSTPRVSAGLDVASTAGGAAMGAVSVGARVELPLGRAWALDLEPAGYGSWGTGVSVVQLNAAGLARFYFTSLYAHETAREVQWGPFIAAGAVASWEHLEGTATVDVLAAGPVARGGYRLVFGTKGIYLEPTVGATALFGTELGSGGGSTFAMSATAGFTVGYRF